MSRTRLGRAAIVSLTLGAATVACNPGGGHVASAGGMPVRADAAAAKLAAAAREALARHDAARAVRYAERAVAAAPGDAGHRALLGHAYLAAGRFASAGTSLRESLSLAPEQPRARLDLALAEIAQGQSEAARADLAALDGKVADADLGLATALSGDRDHAIARLSDVVRSGRSDARARQNLALAYALDGRWGEARAMAMQDMTPDQVNDRIAGWARLVGANDPRVQVAAMLGAAPAVADPGRPAMLALAAPAAPAAPVALAAADVPAVPVTPSPVTPSPVTPAPAPVAQAAPAPAPVPAAPIPRPAPAPQAFAAAAVPAPAAVPELLAAPRPVTVSFAHAEPPRIAPGPLLRPAARGGFVVQLGAFSRARMLEAAWSRASRLSPRIASFSPVSGRTSVSGATLVRLSIGGFGERAQATGLCRQIRARGGVCFVRRQRDDTPWQWARSDGGDRLAMAAARIGA